MTSFLRKVAYVYYKLASFKALPTNFPHIPPKSHICPEKSPKLIIQIGLKTVHKHLPNKKPFKGFLKAFS